MLEYTQFSLDKVYTFLLFPSRVILDYYKVHISHISPNVPLFKALYFPPSLPLFRFLYLPMITKDWISLSLHRGIIDIYDGLPSSIKKWKEKFFFIDPSVVAMGMQFGNLVNCDSEPAPKLTITEHGLVKRLITNYIVWSNPDESTLSLANLNNTYGAPGAVSVPTLRGNNPSLLERLHRKRQSKVAKGSSSSTPKADFSSNVDVAGESEMSLDSIILNSPTKSNGPVSSSSKNIHGKLHPVPPYSSTKGVSSDAPTKAPKRKVRLSNFFWDLWYSSPVLP